MQTPLREMQFTKGKRLPSLTAILRDGDSGDALDLEELGFSSVLFRMVSDDGVTVKIDNAAGVIVDAPAGVVRYDWSANDVNTAGRYHGWFIAVDGAGLQEQFPVGKKLVIEFIATP
jgi:hypothetical protein